VIRQRIKKALVSVAWLAVFLGIVYLREGSVPILLVALFGGFMAIFLGFGFFEDARDRRHERDVLAALSGLGGSATLSDLEASLFDGSTAFAKVQQLRDAIARLREGGLIAEADDRLRLKR
jgi:hypothetical protein